MPLPDASTVGREPPHMGPVAHGFAELGHTAERAVSTVAAFVADAVQAPSRLGDAAALLTADGRLGTVWQVTVPFAGLLLGAAAVALVVHRLLRLQRSALARLRPSSASPFALGLLRSLLVDAAPLAAYACLAAGGSFLFFWDRGLVFSSTVTFRMVASLVISTSVVAWLLFVVLSLPLAVDRPGWPSPSSIPEKRVRPDADAAARQPRSEEGAGLDDFNWHGGAITRATPVTPSFRSTQNVRRFLHTSGGPSVDDRWEEHSISSPS